MRVQIKRGEIRDVQTPRYFFFFYVIIRRNKPQRELIRNKFRKNAKDFLLLFAFHIDRRKYWGAPQAQGHIGIPQTIKTNKNQKLIVFSLSLGATLIHFVVGHFANIYKVTFRMMIAHFHGYH